MAKSADAFRTISEVADWLETPAHVLRFWESKFSQVKPVKRAGGRRYYRPTDMQLLGGIKKLLHEDGMTIKGVQKMLREQGVKHVIALSQPLEDEALAGAIDITPEPAPKAASKPTPEAVPEAETTPDDAPAVLSFKRAAQPEAAPEPEPKADPAPAPDPVEPVLPSFSNLRGAKPKEDAEPATDAAPEPEPAAPPPPKPAKIDVPDDPDDTVAAPAGVLSRLLGVKRTLPAASRDQLGGIADRLRNAVEKSRST